MQTLNRISVILLSLIGISTIIGTTQAQAAPLHYICPNTTTFARNSTYESNLRILLSSLASNGTPSTGFYNASVGRYPDDVYGLYLCGGDVGTDDCQQCVNQSTGYILSSCREAVVWYDNCLLRYSNVPVSPSLNLRDAVYMWNAGNITGNQASFMELVGTSLRDIAEVAAASSRKFAMNYSSNSVETVYTLMQCTPDLATWECGQCLQYLISLSSCCTYRTGGRILAPSCSFRYETYHTAIAIPSPLQPLPPAPAPAPPPSIASRGKRSDSRKMVISVSISSIIGLQLLLLGCYIYILRKRKKLKKVGVSENIQEFHFLDLERSRNGDRNPKGSIEEEKPIEPQDFPFIQLDIVRKATHYFSDENKLGEGGFGPVYKGTLDDGKDIAVKRLSRNSDQGLTEFMNEVTLIARVQHKNLVKLIGCCLEKNEKLLIYEYLPNKSLDLFLFDPNLAVQLEWQRRSSIIRGLARGLMYLHEDSRLKIIHRDLKVSNVLLDYDMNPKISDFGMARIFGGNQNQANTNRVVGTYGYMAPEYAMEGLFSVKSDVFSFGVIVLEIISGKRNNGFYLSEQGESLLTYAWKMWSKGQGLELIDPLLTKSRVAEVLKCIHIGLLCVQEDPADRPSMSYVVVMLASDTIALPRPLQPAFSVGRVVPIPSKSSNDKIYSVNQVTLSNVSPR